MLSFKILNMNFFVEETVTIIRKITMSTAINNQIKSCGNIIRHCQVRVQEKNHIICGKIYSRFKTQLQSMKQIKIAEKYPKFIIMFLFESSLIHNMIITKFVWWKVWRLWPQVLFLQYLILKFLTQIIIQPNCRDVVVPVIGTRFGTSNNTTE